MKKKTKSLKRPIVMYSITEDCQMRCKHCYNESGQGKHNPSTEELFDNTKKMSKVAGAINFTGGEPFLRPELPELLALSSSNNTDNIITTNGLCFMEKDASKLLERIQEDVYMLKIGMMGAVPETNDSIRGRGHFDVALKALNLMANYDLISCIKVSLDRHNMHEVEAFAQLALEHGVNQIVFGQLVQIGRASKYLRELVMDSDELQGVGDEIKRVKQKYWEDIKIASHCTLSGLCSKPRHFYTVTARGGVSPCLMREDLAIGDVSADDITGLFECVDELRSRVKTHSSVEDAPRLAYYPKQEETALVCQYI